MPNSRGGLCAVTLLSPFDSRGTFEVPMDVQVFSRNQLISRVRLAEEVMSHLISIANPALGPEEGEATGLPGEIEAAFEEVLRLRFFDVEDDGDLPPAWREGIASRADV